jgi:hypothetical protein
MKIKAPSVSSNKVDRGDFGTSKPKTAPDSGAPSKPAASPSQDRFSSSFTPSAPKGKPHLANPADAGVMRPQIAQQAQNNPSFYGTLVGAVNSGLQKAGIGISPASHQSVMNNLQQVHAGKMSQGTAHFTEAAGFAQDAVNSFAHGRPLQGAVEASGVALNTVGGIGMSLLQGLGKISKGATPSELNGTGPW